MGPTHTLPGFTCFTTQGAASGAAQPFAIMFEEDPVAFRMARTFWSTVIINWCYQNLSVNFDYYSSCIETVKQITGSALCSLTHQNCSALLGDVEERTTVLTKRTRTHGMFICSPRFQCVTINQLLRSSNFKLVGRKNLSYCNPQMLFEMCTNSSLSNVCQQQLSSRGCFNTCRRLPIATGLQRFSNHVVAWMKLFKVSK